jgi:hypothetical protein
MLPPAFAGPAGNDEALPPVALGSTALSGLSPPAEQPIGSGLIQLSSVTFSHLWITGNHLFDMERAPVRPNNGRSTSTQRLSGKLHTTVDHGR